VSHVPVRPKDKARLISMNENYKGAHRNKPENYFLGATRYQGCLVNSHPCKLPYKISKIIGEHKCEGRAKAAALPPKHELRSLR
jgi:hypothetical protein